MWTENVQSLKEYLSAAFALALFVTLIGMIHLSLYSSGYFYYDPDASNALHFTNDNPLKEEFIPETQDDLGHALVTFNPNPKPNSTPRLLVRKPVVESSAIH